jgi:hypothetical protein
MGSLLKRTEKVESGKTILIQRAVSPAGLMFLVLFLKRTIPIQLHCLLLLDTPDLVKVTLRNDLPFNFMLRTQLSAKSTLAGAYIMNLLIA